MKFTMFMLMLWLIILSACPVTAGPISTISSSDKLDSEYQHAAVAPIFLQGLIALEQNKLPVARQAFESALKQDSKFVPAFIGLAGIANISGDDVQAQLYLQQALELAPKAAIVYLAKGRYFLSKQQLDEAEQQFLQAKDLQNHSGQAALISLGELYLRHSNKIADALVLFKQALNKDPNNGYLHYLAGMASALLAQPTPAQQYFETAIRLAPVNVLPLQGLSRLLLEQNQPEQAIIKLQQAIALEPSNIPVLLDLSDAMALTGQFSAASEVLSKAEKLAPQLADIYQKKADIAQAQQQWDSALSLYDQAIQLNSNFALALNNKAWVLLTLKRDLPKAAAAAQQAVSLSARSAPFHDTLAMVLLEMKDLQAAMKAIDAAIAIEPAVAEFHYHKGLIATAMQQTAMAKQSLQKALQLDPAYQPAMQALKQQ